MIFVTRKFCLNSLSLNIFLEKLHQLIHSIIIKKTYKNHQRRRMRRFEFLSKKISFYIIIHICVLCDTYG